MIDAIRVVGMDPSLRNWGLAEGTYNPVTNQTTLSSVSVVQPTLPTGKQIRKNSLDLEAGAQLHAAVHRILQSADIVFVEVPQGSQSARAAAGYGICIGVLASIHATHIPLFEISPTEVKLATVGKKTATKKEIVDRAVELHPYANWPRYKRHGELLVSYTDAEHMADAVGAIEAGVRQDSFKQLLSLTLAMQTKKESVCTSN